MAQVAAKRGRMTASNASTLRYPKGKTRKQLKAREDREETKREQVVRGECVERDGHCAVKGYDWILGRCDGDSEWAHHHARGRWRTRGMPPEYRHHRRFSFMGCTRHHSAYDRHD